jgi:TP901 family phage tail tape measure protein
MASTKTEHLTSLSFNLTDMKAQLDSIPASVQEAAIKAQKAWDDNFNAGFNTNGTGGSCVGGSKSGGKSGGGGIVSATKSQLESLILQYKNFEATLSRTKIYPESIGTMKKAMSEATSDLTALTKNLDANGKLTGESAQKYQDFASKLKGAKGELADLSKKANEAAGATNNVGASADKAGGFISNFLGKLADKARWLAAFYLIQSVINGFQQLVSTIKDTEQAVVEIQRVMNEEVSSANVSKELYAIAYEYGRTFEEVQNSATLFAQTGKSWNDVLTLTRGTMLALNTAELDVTQATEGLIAVMAQWNMGAEDYVGVIDKINKTADDYAITSEKIVAALQRSGGTAKAYGMTLDELIGIITALGEATGRSGENIGTAINSLITYTTKAKSIDVLEKMGIDAKDAEGNLLPVLQIWSQLAQKIKGGDLAFADFMASDQEAMDAFLADSEEYQQAVKDTIASGKEVQDAYSIAGTYRKNYFIALLNNLGTAEEAMKGMATAEGYSAIENAKQMETLVNRSNQFAAVWKDAATQLGDAGVLDLIKFFVSVGTEIGKVTQETGGLLNIFAGVVAIIVKVNALKFGTRIAALVGHLKNMVNPIRAIQLRYQSLNDAIGIAKTKVELYKKALESSTTAEEIAANKKRLLRAENELTNASYAKLATTFSYVLTAITAVVAVYSYLTQKQEENYQAILKSATAASENASSLEKLIEQYKKLASASGGTYLLAEQEAEARDIQDQIVALVGDQKNGLDLVNGAIDTQIQKLQQVRGVQNEITKQQAQIAYDAAKAASAKGMYGTGGGGRATLGGFIDFIKGYFGTLFQSISGGAKSAIEEAYATIGEDSPFANGGSLVDLLGGSAREDIATIDSIIETILRANTAAAAMGETLDNSGVLVFLNALREQLQGVVDTENQMGDALYKALAPETIKEYFDLFDMEAEGAQETFDAYIRTLNNPNVTLFNADGSIMSREVRDALIEAAYELFPDLANAVNLYDTSVSEGAQANGLFTTSLEKLKEQMSDFTSQIDGVQSSLKTLQDVVSEYNETGLMSVDMIQQLLELDPEYVALLDFTANGLQMNEEATRNLIDAKKELIDASIALKSAEMADALASEYNAYATDAEYDATQKASNSATAAASGLQSLINSAYASGYSVQALAQKLYELGYVQDASGSKALAMAADVLTASRAMYNYGAAAQFASSSLSSLASWTGGTNGTKTSGGGGGGGGGGEDPQIKILEARKKAIEETAKAQIDALKEVQDAEDRKRRRDEYLADKSEALADVRRAQSRSGIDAREDEADAEKKLADVNKDWQEQLQDWNLDDQIKAIEEWKDAMVDAIDAQIEALRSAGGGGGGGGGGVSDMFSSEAEVLTQNKDVLLAALLEMDNENLPEKIKAFYQLFDASQYTSDVDFADQLAGIKTDWDTFESENGDEFAIHYKTVLDDGTSLTQEQLTEYLDGLAAKAANESEFFQLDQGAGGLGILLRVTPSAETDQETEDQWSQTVTDLGEALDKMFSLWEFDNLDTDSARQAIEDAFNEAFDAAEQAATDSGVVIEQQMSKAADDTGAEMLSSVNGYSPQIVDAWNNNLINPMIGGLGDLSDSLDGVLAKLGNVAAFGGISGIGNGAYSSVSNISQNQNNFVTLRGSGQSQTDPFARWFI